MSNFKLNKKIKINKSFFIKLIFSIFIFNISSNSIFINRYLTPEPIVDPLIPNRNEIEGINISFFNLSASKGHSSDKYYNSERSDLFNFASVLNLYTLEEGINYTKSQANTLSDSGYEKFIGIPSEWKASDALIYMSMPGKINGSGFSWNIKKNIFDRLIVGWSSGFIFNQSALKLDARSLETKFNLNFSNLFEIFRVYNNLATALQISDLFEKRSSLLDQNFYLNYNFFVDFLVGLRRLSCDLKAGVLLPTAYERDINNPASIPLGTDGHYGMYGAFEADFLLKEDLNFGLITKIYKLFSKNKPYRLSSKNENPLYGSITEEARVSPGLTSSFSAYLTIEGIREGLGLKVDYSTFNHFEDNIIILNKNINYNESFNKNFTKWAQEHFGVSIFYDFMRNENEREFEPFLSFTAKIPVNFFFSHNSAKCFSLALSLEVMY